MPMIAVPLCLGVMVALTPPALTRPSSPPSPEASPPRVLEATTGDDVVLRMLHYPNPDGVPVILQAPFTTNHLAMDLPVPGYSVAQWFHARGYDVYVPNLRGHGEGDIFSEAPEKCRWSLDDFIAWDADAIVARVRQESGQAPYWIGHSLGAMVGYGYLMGATYRDVVVDRIWVREGAFGWRLQDVVAPRIVQDSALAKTRQSQVAGLVTLAGPTRISWPVYINWWNWPRYLFDSGRFWTYNLVVDQLSHDRYAQMAVGLMACMPIEDVTEFLTADIRDLPFVGIPLAKFLEWVFETGGTSFLAAHVYNPANMDAEVIEAYVTRSVDNTSARVLQQFMQGVRMRGWRAFEHRDPLHEPFRYGSHMSDLELPLLFVTGALDKLANAAAIREHGYGQVASVDATLLHLRGYGHVDLAVGVYARDDVWTPVEAWISDRSH